ncbi:MAG: DUF374 domain-containing protein [Phycisphaerae bacterium]|nr:DUF374 domain-containing protein [Phycisphaerae bacterium]
MSLTARIAAATIRLIGRSLRYRFVLDDPDVVPQRMQTPAIYVFWHDMLLLPAYTHGAQIVPLISRSGEGSMLDEVIRSFGGRTIRGSTDHGGKTRGGSTALREMLRQGTRRHIGIPIDGPVGHPRKITSRGVAWAASRGNMPVIPVGIATKVLHCFGHADRQLNLPMMFSRAWFVAGKPLRVPPNAHKSQAQAFIEQLQAALDDCQARAETYARSGRSPVPPLTLKALRAL